MAIRLVLSACVALSALGAAAEAKRVLDGLGAIGEGDVLRSLRYEADTSTLPLTKSEQPEDAKNGEIRCG